MKTLSIHPDREVALVITPGGRVGYVKWRNRNHKRITVRYFDGDGSDEVTVDESLPGLRFVKVKARDLFRKEAGEGRYASAAASRKSGTRGAGGKASSSARAGRGTPRSLRA